MPRTKVLLALTDDAIKLLATHASERKRGELVGKALAEYATKKEAGGAGVLERIEQRLARIEAELVAMQQAKQ